MKDSVDELVRLLRVPPTGEPRVPLFHVKDGQHDAFRAAFRELRTSQQRLANTVILGICQPEGAAVRGGDRQKALQEFFRVRPSANGQEIDDLDKLLWGPTGNLSDHG